jgi:hypothetical protein
MIETGGRSAEKGQPGIDRAALFGLDDPRMPSRRVLYAVMLPLIVGLVLAALTLDDALHPPLWAHALIWPPVVIVVIVGAVRLLQRAHPPRNGEGDHPQDGGGALPYRGDISIGAPCGETPPPRSTRSPSPSREGFE